MDKTKNKTVAIVLAILLGGFGAHKFYLGQTGMGVLYAVFCWTGIPFVVGLVEGILMIFMSQDKFNSKYNA